MACESAAVFHFGADVGEGGGAVGPDDVEGGVFNDVHRRCAVDAVRGRG